MVKISYRIVKHEDGWAYQVQGTFSEAFATHELAMNVARNAAFEQKLPGEDVGISYEDSSGQWHEELSRGSDRPKVQVEK